MTGSNDAIAIVGLACCYPQAGTPLELWENVLAQRCAFRPIPQERLRLADYSADQRRHADSISLREAGLIEGYEPDRVGLKISGDAYRVTDLAHWLALDVATRALADAGLEPHQVPRQSSGVLVGNTLTGEISRTQLMRLRWPYVRRTTAAALAAEGLDQEQCSRLLEQLERIYMAPFPEPNEESLAGGLSNTIAGRIANHLDLQGGGYTVDGACASSLLAVVTACSALTSGDLDLAFAGGVDLSLDPFELVGFSRAGALARGEMRVYDQASAGFKPGEGCGFAVLMRADDAARRKLRVYAVIRGWGISSDGSGGITRPEARGQLLALQRAYRRAGLGIDRVALIEGHGTGTVIGDATELAVLNQARREAGCSAAGHRAAIGSIKANIGHTKAAAGIAGLIKATMAVDQQVLPPISLCLQPHDEIAGPESTLRVLRQPEPWPRQEQLLAGVSSMGFGGINAHLVIEGPAKQRRSGLSSHQRRLGASPQDAELLLLAADSWEQLATQVDRLHEIAGRLAASELAELASELVSLLPEQRPLRAAVVATSPAQLSSRLKELHAWLQQSPPSDRLQPEEGLFLGSGGDPPRIGLVFPGQGSPAYPHGGAWRRRFDQVDRLYSDSGLSTEPDKAIDTALVQPAVVTASLAGLQLLGQLGIGAHLAVGHSLGELTALHWAGAYDASALIELATVRGRAMAEHGDVAGEMAALEAPAAEVTELIAENLSQPVVIAGINLPRQTVISGSAEAVAEALSRATARGWKATRLPVSHAFHSPLVAGAAAALAEAIAKTCRQRLQRRIVSTVTGKELAPDHDLGDLLCRQLTSPVRFLDAMTLACGEIDVFLEVGPGAVLSRMVGQLCRQPIVALDAGSDSVAGLLLAAGILFAMGSPVAAETLFTDRALRRFDLDHQPRFISNPCEQAPPSDLLEQSLPEAPDRLVQAASVPAGRAGQPPLVLVRELVAQRTELPVAAITEQSRLLADLHLSSIVVSQLVAEACRQLGISLPVAGTDFAGASVGEVAAALKELQLTQGSALEPNELVSGIDSWVRPFTMVEVEQPLRPGAPASGGRGGKPGHWQVLPGADQGLAAALHEAFAGAEGHGVILLNPVAGDPAPLLSAGRTVVNAGGRLVVVQQRASCDALARTLHLEHPGVAVTVIGLPEGCASDPQPWAQLVRAEAMSTRGFSEVIYGSDGRRWQPLLRPLDQVEPEHAAAGLGPDDLILVSGGGKGITAECALALATRCGARLAILGRSSTDESQELAANLERMRGAGVRLVYLQADLTDAAAVRAAVERAEAELGPVTAVLHGAGSNRPRLLAELSVADFQATMAPKVDGLRTLLDAVPSDQLQLLVVFGSIISRTGMRGEADYAVSNQWLRCLSEEYAAENRGCRCLCIEWSVWAGTGMGERLGRIEALARAGITPITPERGVAILEELLSRPWQPEEPVSVIVTGRFGEPPTMMVERPQLPLLRFLERPRVYFPGIELIADAELSHDSDPYLDDHMLDQEPLLPAVIGLEAMAQAAMAVTGSRQPPVLEEVELAQPIVVPAGTQETMRVATLVRRSGEVELALRCSTTMLQTDHFRAVCKWPGSMPESEQPPYSFTEESLPLVPEQDLYDSGILFHRGRFRRLLSYSLLQADACVAMISGGFAGTWFGRFLPADLMLGDPSVRDAAVHAIQASIPHATVLPVRVRRVVPGLLTGPGPWQVRGQQLEQDGKRLVWDLEILDQQGNLVEIWQGLELQVVKEEQLPVMAPPLLRPYLQRRLAELIAEVPAVLVERCTSNDDTDRRVRSLQAARHLLPDAEVCWRPDGKPELAVGAISFSHCDDLVLVAAGDGPLGCDLEQVKARSRQSWSDLLRSQRLALAEQISEATGEDTDISATRVWTVLESLKKAGAMSDTPLLLEETAGDGWVLISAGSMTCTTGLLAVAGCDRPLVIGLAVPRKA
jgi:enediyne polyketide synthase